MELTVERGRGYVTAAQNKQPGQEIGRIPVDSIYSPVLKVTYRVEATRVEQRTDFDRLIIDVETKPSIALRATRWPPPAPPWSSCSAWLVSSTRPPRASTLVRRPQDAALAADLALPIEELDLTVRSYNCLKREGIHTRSASSSPVPRPTCSTSATSARSPSTRSR